MAAPARTLLSDLPKGHKFSPIPLTLIPEDVLRYLDAVDDGNAVYLECGLAPPLCVAARALGVLLEVLELPPGTIHSGQELDVRGGVAIGAALMLSGHIAQRSERAGLVICAIEFEVTPGGSNAAALHARTTVMAQAGGAK